MCLDADKSQRILQGLALYMVQENKPEIEEELLIKQLKIIIKQLQEEDLLDEAVDIAIFLQQMIDVSELLVKKDENYEFAHLSFQGYLAAKEIIQTQQDDLLIRNWQNSWWRETILLYSAQVNPNNLFRQLIKIGTKDAVTLALRCIEETPRKIDPEVNAELDNLIEKLNIVLFQKLEEYLKKRQWKKADEETERLMLQIGDKDEKGYLSLDDIKNFPCEELRTINDLWVNNSEGKFGFTVQKQIWLDCGGKIGKYKYEPYKKFAEKVKWYNRATDKWYDDITYELGENTGHLPIIIPIIHILLQQRMKEERSISFLAQRLINCKI